MRKLILLNLALMLSFNALAQEKGEISRFGFSAIGEFGNAKIITKDDISRNVNFSGSQISMNYRVSKQVDLHIGYGVYQGSGNFSENGQAVYLDQSMTTIPVGVVWSNIFEDKKVDWIDVSLGLDIYGKTIDKSKIYTANDVDVTKNFGWNLGVKFSCYLDFNLYSNVIISTGIASFQDFGYNSKNGVSQKIDSSNLFSLKFSYIMK